MRTRWLSELSSTRWQHLVFLAHVWVFAPFLVFWLRDPGAIARVGERAYGELRPVVVLTVGYLVLRTWLAFLDPKWLKWQYAFPPVDVAVITAILSVSHRGPLSNVMLLFFLPIIEAAGSLNVRWAAVTGLMVVAGTAISTQFGLGAVHDLHAGSLRELWQEDPVNVAFRLVFLIVVSSLMAFQASIAAHTKQRLAVAADRNRIASDMHDGVQAHLITLASQLELIARLAPSDGLRAAGIAHEAREVARQGADELRFLVHRMREPVFEGGFVTGLRQYADNFCARNGLRLEFQVRGVQRPLSPEADAALFRVAQEALNNVAKHSEATHVVMEVRFGAGGTTLSVQDDGNGFEPVDRAGSAGITGMAERLDRIGGSLRLRSALGEGTTLEATIQT